MKILYIEQHQIVLFDVHVYRHLDPIFKQTTSRIFHTRNLNNHNGYRTSMNVAHCISHRQVGALAYWSFQVN